VPDRRPARCRLRMYQVGFGDCFLLSFEYADPLDDGRLVRHILVDFGSTRPPTGWQSLAAVARQIKVHTAGEIDVVVVTHRHKDHLSAFGSPELVSFMAAGFPRLVVRSWTERPELDSQATGDGSAVGPKSTALIGRVVRARSFAAALGAKLQGAAARSLAAEVAQLADDQLQNEAAVQQLERWAGDTGRYLHYGLPSGIEEVVPGLAVKVLGPPTVDQYPPVASQRSRDPDEFWMIYQGLLEIQADADLIDTPAAAQPDAVPDPSENQAQAAPNGLTAADEAPAPATAVGPVGPVRWLTDRMGRQNLNSLLRIVRILDDVLNNTSVILLFELATADGPLRLLFPGDAQIENWEYALKHAPDRADNLQLLREVDLYKVGHHGSRNATPRTLFNLWNEPATASRPLAAVMSTKSGVHGKSPATAVPRQTLVAALDTRTNRRLYSTEGLTSKTPYVELLANLDEGRTIEVVNPGSRRESGGLQP
jgi:hypothetical protein